MDANRIARKVAEIPALAAKDKKYRNAMKNPDRQNARLESGRALSDVMSALRSDDMELYKQYSDNSTFKLWLAEQVFKPTCNPGGRPAAQH